MDQAAQPDLSSADLIKDVSMHSFMADVIEASMTKPVLVDFWAPWCGPCKTLGPILEKLTLEAKGAHILAKINLDENQPLAGQMGVQSIPTVFAFWQGQPINGFAGAIPESEIQKFLQQIYDATGQKAEVELPAIDEASLKEILQQGEELLLHKDYSNALTLYRHIHEQMPKDTQGFIGLARCLTSLEAFEDYKTAFEALDDELKANAQIKELDNLIKGLESQSPAQNAAKAQQELSENNANIKAYLDFASNLFLLGQSELSMQVLLEAIKQSAGTDDNSAREKLLQIFAILGVMHPSTIAGRKLLSTLLFS